MKVQLLTESELRQCIDLDLEGLAAIERGFTELSAGRVVQPPIMRVDVVERNGEVDIKSAYVPGEPSFAVKLSSGFFDNPKRGLPSASGMMILISSETGRPEALLLDNGYLTNVRTALAGAVAAKHLAPEGPLRVGILGTGAQARHQLRALCMVRDVVAVQVFGRDSRRVASFISDMRAYTPRAAASVPALVASCDVLITTTPSRSPLVHARDLHPGLHITAIGSDAEDKQELDGGVLEAADLFVCDRRSQSERLGELRGALEGGTAPSSVVEIGEITSGQHPLRTQSDQITVCDLTGTGVQDTMIARLAHQRAKESGLGTTIEL